MYKGKYLSVIIAAGGMGTRFGADSKESAPKQYINIGGKSMIVAAAEPFFKCCDADEIVFVVPDGYLTHTCGIIVKEMSGFWIHAASSAQKLTVNYGGRDHIVRVVHGGQDRAASVRSGLEAIGEDAAGGIVLIHDAARPFVTRDLILRVLEAAHAYGAAVPVTPVNDTIYGYGEDGFAAGIPERDRLRGAQTPQGFDLALIKEGHWRALAEGLSLTDDGAAVFACGARVALVEGDTANIKVTLPEDLSEASAPGIGGDRVRVGIGFDAHRFSEGRALVLGGVSIPHDKGLLGHSDADVLTHALMDAILGALHEGDIGKLFPDSDPALAGISSFTLLSGVVSLMKKRGYEIGNADLTLVAERPRIAPYSAEIEKRLASLLETEPERISLKATTTERLGFTGREEGIAAEAIVLLRTSKLRKAEG